MRYKLIKEFEYAVMQCNEIDRILNVLWGTMSYVTTKNTILMLSSMLIFQPPSDSYTCFKVYFFIIMVHFMVYGILS